MCVGALVPESIILPAARASLAIPVALACIPSRRHAAAVMLLDEVSSVVDREESAGTLPLAPGATMGRRFGRVVVVVNADSAVAVRLFWLAQWRFSSTAIAPTQEQRGRTYA